MKTVMKAAMEAVLKCAAFAMLLPVPSFAQRPTNPALMIPQAAPDLGYAINPNPITLPAGVTMGAPAAVAFDSKGHLFVLNRGPQALMEFDAKGTFIRAFGDNLLVRAHGFLIDRDDNLWVTDVTGHVVIKMNHQGNVLLTLGTKGKAGDVNAGLLNQPTGIAISRKGEIYVVQGHTPDGGDPRLAKYDRNGKFLKTWGGKGSEPGKFAVAHGIAIDTKGLLWVTDRENQRVQIFDGDGKFIREIKYAGLPCALNIGRDSIYMVNGYGAQLLKLDLDGRVLAAMGKTGKGTGEFGEAHAMAVSAAGEVFVADSVNSTLQKFTPQKPTQR